MEEPWLELVPFSQNQGWNLHTRQFTSYTASDHARAEASPLNGTFHIMNDSGKGS